jgi:hypothetical protein
MLPSVPIRFIITEFVLGAHLTIYPHPNELLKVQPERCRLTYMNLTSAQAT